MTKHNFKLMDIFESAWSKTKEHAWFLFCIFLMSVLLTCVTGFMPIIGSLTSLFVGIAVTYISIVIASDKTPIYGDLIRCFKSYKITLHYAIATFLYAIIVLLGLILFILPGIYLAVRLGFYKFLVIEYENMKAVDSLKESMKITSGYFWKIFGFVILLIIINILGAIPFGLGLIITIPVSVIAGAVLYKKLAVHHIS